MKLETVTKKLDKLSKTLVMADVDDLPSIGELLKQLEDFSKIDCKKCPSIVFEASSKAVVLAEKIVLEDAPDREATLDVVSKTVSCMQSIVRDGIDPKEVGFPPDLGIGGEKAPEVSDESGFGLPANVDEEIFSEFLANQDSVLEEMEGHILAIEKGDGPEAMNVLRRLLHTLKGEAGALGLTDIGDVCHKTEDFLQEAGSPTPVDTLLAVKDWFAGRFEDYRSKNRTSEPVDVILSRLLARQPVEAEAQPEEGEEHDESPQVVPLESDPTLLGDFISEANEHLESVDADLLNIEGDPGNQDALDAVFRAFHTMKGTAGFLNLDDIKELAHTTETLLDRARKGDIVLAGGAIDIVFDVVDRMKRYMADLAASLSKGEGLSRDDSLPELISKIEAVASGDVPEQADKKIGEILVDSGVTTPKQVDDALATQESEASEKKLGQVMVEKGYAPAKEVAGALRQQQAAKGQVKETVKVDASRIDLLVDTIGELVIAETMVTQDPEVCQGASIRVQKNFRQLTKVARELQELGMAMRMVSLKGIFQKMARLVRDLAKKSGKKVNFVMSGEETEIDRSVVDYIGDPLIHLIRNAVDHGIESSEKDRKEAGKPEYGTVELNAFHKGGNIYIEVKDDGGGLDKDAILIKAKERGLIAFEDTLSDQEIINLILEPGFSTAKKVTDVSGRGVGMDVVKKNIEALRGRIEVSTEPGKGSTFTMILPLTLAIIDGMVVKVGAERYIIPTLSITESLSPKSDMITTVVGKGEMLSVRGELMPLFRLSRLFEVQDAKEDFAAGLAVVVESGMKRVAVLVDELIGQQQTVIKGLSKALGKTDGLSGASIMADGHVGLILDVPGIIKMVAES
ncbi:MAG: chemotaxis protein CheA [Thermodesulfobacteriota bacterium]|nr:chemotaxis protein CheA [Thermodesulfobacteriota bacterium]